MFKKENHWNTCTQLYTVLLNLILFSGLKLKKREQTVESSSNLKRRGELEPHQNADRCMRFDLHDHQTAFNIEHQTHLRSAPSPIWNYFQLRDSGGPKTESLSIKAKNKMKLKKKNHFSHSSERREKSFPSTTLRPIQHTYCSDILSLGERLQFKCDVYTVLQRGLSLSLYVLKINHGVTSGRTQSQAQHHICWWLNDSLSHIPKENITYTDM